VCVTEPALQDGHSRGTNADQQSHYRQGHAGQGDPGELLLQPHLTARGAGNQVLVVIMCSLVTNIEVSTLKGPGFDS